jgi:hypothetical protein
MIDFMAWHEVAEAEVMITRSLLPLGCQAKDFSQLHGWCTYQDAVTGMRLQQEDNEGW